MMIRKVMIGAASLLVAALLFIGYIRLTGTKGIQLADTAQIADIPDKPATGQASQIDKTTIYSATQAVYPIMDPQTKKVLRIFGFEALLNPGQQSGTWQVRRPYMNVLENKFYCRLDAEEGSIQMEYSGGKPIPKDARLTGGVVVRIFPGKKQRFGETVILLDDMNYSSERSEFFTDGPVELISPQAHLVGRGMQMIYHPQHQRIEYFQIKKLDSLRIKKAVASHVMGKSPEPLDSSKPVSESKPAAAAAAPAQPAQAGPETAGQKPAYPYQCSIRKDVVIQYGRELIVQGADEVNILNVLFNSSSIAQSETEAGLPVSTSADSQPDSQPVSQASPLEGITWADRTRLPQMPADNDDVDVIVTCTGGIVVQPMDGGFKDPSPAAMDVRINGSPMQVMRQNLASRGNALPLILCQSMSYLPTTDVLRLFPGDTAQKVRVFMDTERNYLETPGDMQWNIKDRHARVNGAGRIVFDTATQKKPEQAELNFGRQMDVYFAPAPDIDNGRLFLTSVNLTGGMDAVIGQGGLKTEAQSARFEFGQANQLTSAKLSGSVRFASDSAAHAQADDALLTFDLDNTLQVADLKGNVAFASAQGQFTSDDAKIQFAKNQDGQLEPQSLTSTTDSALVSTATDPTLPPVKFEAKKMDYDLSKGSAFALGPIRFSFYTPADANDPGSSVPVIITAQRNAVFLAGPDKKTIHQAIFHGNVVGESVAEKNTEKTVHRFYGDTLTVDLAADTRGRTSISHVAVTDGDVKLQAIRYLDGVKVNHVELRPARFDYQAASETITAMGPGKIELNNQDVSADADAATQTFNFKQPCYALVEGFEKLVWQVNEHKMTADGSKETLNLSYLTMKNNVPDKLTRAAVSTAELVFGKDPTGKDVLSQLTADGGVYLEQKDEHVLKGQKMFYAANDGWLHIEGTEKRPCFVDGAPVPVIHYNFQTGKLETKLGKSPSAITLPQ